MWKALPFAVSFWATQASAELPIQFVEEHVAMAVDGAACVIDGQYVIRNRSDSDIGVKIDFPYISGGIHPPEVLLVAGAELVANTNEHVVVNMHLGPSASQTLRIRYRQDFGPKRGRYLVSTAQIWGLPLEHAVFVATAPKAWGPPQSPWPAPEKQCDDRTCTWHWSFTSFWPKDEWDLTW